MQSKPKSLIIKIKTEGEIFVFPVEELDTMVTHTYYCWKRIVLINSYHFIFSRWPSDDIKDMSSQSSAEILQWKWSMFTQSVSSQLESICYH